MKATHKSYKVGLVALVLLLGLTAFSACNRCGDIDTPQAQDSPQAIETDPSKAQPKRATPHPVARDAKKRKPRPTPPWHMDIKVWVTQTAASIGEGDAKTERQLARGQGMIANGIDGDRVSVVLRSGERATVPFCDTNIGLLASQFDPKNPRGSRRAAALPASVRMRAAKAYPTCISKVAADPNRGVVLQESVPVASETGKPPGDNAARLATWQILDVLETDLPGGLIKLRTSPEETALFDRHDIAVGGEPGFEWFSSPHGSHLIRYLNPEKSQLDFWFVLHGFSRMIPTAINASEDDDSWKSGWRDGPRQLERMRWEPPVRSFLLQKKWLLSHLQREWMPARDAELTQCSQLGMRLVFDAKTLRITAADGAKQSHKLGELTLHANATATLSQAADRTQDLAILYWVGESKHELITEWMTVPLIGHLVPQTWVPLDATLEAQFIEAAQKRLNCPPEAPQRQ